jgi:hypothetical protein
VVTTGKIKEIKREQRRTNRLMNNSRIMIIGIKEKITMNSYHSRLEALNLMNTIR